ncbi:MAG TPA: hypothetical protein VF169_17330 [Albitalea sp.]|uniref:hypothetical protein n=1 Tax=Piscinibacter sp. TaxID=1903157 RepID=UPI002ED49125
MTRALNTAWTSMLAVALAACGGGGDAGGMPAAAPVAAPAPGAQALQAEIDQLFPFTPNQPLEMTYACGRSNSQLTYYFVFHADLTFRVYIELDNYQQVTFDGTYTHAGGAIHMQALNNPVLPLDETTTRIVPHLGLVGEFQTPAMACGAVGHGYNDPAVESFKSYDCPLINIGAASDEDNSFEFTHSANPFGVVVRGGTFRQRDVNVVGTTNPNVWRGYGIFRRVGNTFYADYGSQFPDYNLLKGTFANGDQQVSVEQLEPGKGPCNRR